ncbi:MAG: bifunctional imidazole glycerol-phosphate dehydratase/histidinol phosphatase [Bacteroidetes bacterium GWF2_33_16]|nr:MAG: bifunctional imidazole glycerol-phosphate dehydratase/histidinol phosphatase [Bacteroidetes bacterium GWE2_32_14]OFY02986.1 MAG: bifunctional imidazole glycerol-phosphate dehydratase/histidinol phosphatase [Bacteroidetes bacterium GWF2_33_16]
MKKILFLDRDGTLIKEPDDQQIDTLEKLEFIPGVFRNLFKLVKQYDYELVMVTNQDGLGTISYPIETFYKVQEKLEKTFFNEEIEFKDILIDCSFPDEKRPTRKPAKGLVEKYLNECLDYEKSFVIGDRITDLQLAKNMGIKGILLTTKDLYFDIIDNNNLFACSSWDEITDVVRKNYRSVKTIRKTNETDIEINLSLDGNGTSNISTGQRFLDHMLEQLGKHTGVDLSIKVKGDLDVDEHHTIEDTALALGETFRKALGNKKGIERYGFTLPMDDCLAQVAIDFGGRPWLVWNADFKHEKIGDLPTEMFYHFFKSFSDAAQCNLNIKAEGTNEHHKIESIFKALAKAIKLAIKQNVNKMQIPSTKGIL